MKISTMYDITWQIKNKTLSQFVYKINKFMVNIAYPKTVKLSYGLDEKSNVIVSLTSFPARINTVWITIATILNQSVKPQKIVLWLAEDQFPNREKDIPDNLLRLKRYGLSIRFCDNLYPHKKYYYTMKENPQATVITVDDDVFYPEYLIEELMSTSKKYPGIVCCTWAHRIAMDSNHKICAYSKWEYGISNNEKPEMKVIPIGIGGVLYPPNCLDSRVFDKGMIEKLSLMTDDLWLKTMEILNDTPAVRIEKAYRRTFFTLTKTQKSGLYHNNVAANHNDLAMTRLIQTYPQIEELLGKGAV